jgi:hypothetical protein
MIKYLVLIICLILISYGASDVLGGRVIRNLDGNLIELDEPEFSTCDEVRVWEQDNCYKSVENNEVNMTRQQCTDYANMIKAECDKVGLTEYMKVK